MLTIETISDKVDLAKAYYLEQLAAIYIKMKSGCGDTQKIQPLKRLIQALTFDIYAELVDATTIVNYNCLMKLLQGFSGAYVLDPDVVVPGQTPIIIVPYEPLTLTYSQADLIEDGAGSGNWYLPLTNAPNRVPVLVLSDGESFDGRYDTNFLIKRYYGFANNATQVIKATFI